MHTGTCACGAGMTQAERFAHLKHGRAYRNDNRPADWTDLRDQWEYSHVIRAVLGLTSLALLTGSLVA